MEMMHKEAYNNALKLSLPFQCDPVKLFPCVETKTKQDTIILSVSSCIVYNMQVLVNENRLKI